MFEGKIGLPGLLVIFGIALLIFGPKKIGELGKGLGEGIRSFRQALREPQPEPTATKSSSETTTTK